MKNKLLFISTQVPSPDLSAGSRTSFNMLSRLLQDYDVDVLLVVNDTHFNKVAIAKLLEKSRDRFSIKVIEVNLLSKITNIIMSVESIFCFRFTNRKDPRAELFVNAWIEKFPAGNFCFDNSESLILFEEEMAGRAEAIIADVVTQRALRESGLSKLSSAYDFQLETKLYKKMSKVYVQSDKDRSLLDNLMGINNIEVYPPGLSPFVYEVFRDAQKIKPFSLLFWGAMHRSENEEAIVYFVESWWVALSEKFPSLTLYIVGVNPSSNLIKCMSAHHNVIVTGFISDPSPYFEESSIGICPLLSGAGIKVKVLEMLECNLPVLSTPIGSEGISHSNLVVSEIDDFGKTLENMLVNEGAGI